MHWRHLGTYGAKIISPCPILLFFSMKKWNWGHIRGKLFPYVPLFSKNGTSQRDFGCICPRGGIGGLFSTTNGTSQRNFGCICPRGGIGELFSTTNGTSQRNFDCICPREGIWGCFQPQMGHHRGFFPIYLTFLISSLPLSSETGV